MNEDRNNGPISEARDAKGRFGKGNAGRPLGARHKLAMTFLEACVKSFELHGEETLETLRLTDPANYTKVIASLVPKEFAMSEESVGKLTITWERGE
jgi:hypothetical protein